MKTNFYNAEFNIRVHAFTYVIIIIMVHIISHTDVLHTCTINRQVHAACYAKFSRHSYERHHFHVHLLSLTSQTLPILYSRRVFSKTSIVMLVVSGLPLLN